MSARGVLLLIYFAGSIPVCFVRPFYGVLLWTVVAFVNPQWYAWGVSGDLAWAQVVAIPTLLGLAVFCGEWNRLGSREIVLTLVLWIWFTTTSVVSANTPVFEMNSADTWAHWQLVSKILLMTAAAAIIVNSFERLRIFLITIACCFGVFLAKALPFMVLTAGTDRLYGPPNSMIADNNDFGLALNMTLPIFFFLAQTETRRWMKCVWWIFFVIAIPGVFLTYSRGALLGLVCVIGFLFLQFRRRFLLIPVLLMGVMIAVLFTPQSWRDRMNPTGPNAVDASARSRLNAWTYCWRLASDYPVFGGGFDTFTQDLFDKYAPNPRDVHGPHSVYFGVLAEQGFPGLGLYLLLVGSCFASTHWIRKHAKYYDDDLAAKYALMLRLSLVGFLVSGAFLGRAYFDYFFTIVACIAVLTRVCRNKWEAQEVGDEALADEGEDHLEVTHAQAANLGYVK